MEVSTGLESPSTTESGRRNNSSALAPSGTAVLARYRRDSNIDMDVRTGQVVVSEIGVGAEDGNSRFSSFDFYSSPCLDYTFISCPCSVLFHS